MRQFTIGSIVMDSDLVYLYMQMQADEEDELDDQERRVAAAALLLIIALGVEESRLICSHLRHPSHLYLCQPQLLSDPRGITPWQQLRASHCNCAYITTMGFDVKTFEFILGQGFAHQWQNTPIPRPDTDLGVGPGQTVACWMLQVH